MLTTITVYRISTWHKNTTSEHGVVFPQVTQDDTLSVSLGTIRKTSSVFSQVARISSPSAAGSLNMTYKSTQHLLEVSVLRMVPSDTDSVSSCVTCGKTTPCSEGFDAFHYRRPDLKMTWNAYFKVFPVLSVNGTTQAYRDITSIHVKGGFTVYDKESPQKHQRHVHRSESVSMELTTSGRRI
jgi:hypothetical protein